MAFINHPFTRVRFRLIRYVIKLSCKKRAGSEVIKYINKLFLISSIVNPVPYNTNGKYLNSVIPIERKPIM